MDLIYRFDEFELDGHHYELRCRGEVRPLPRKGFDLLRYLLSQAGRVVSKEEIFEQIWPSLAVSENVLPVTIRTIRRVLRDEGGVLLRTVRGRGYSIVCPVTEESPERAQAGPEPAPERGFVGREALMQDLEAQFRAAQAGEGRILLIHGDAGVGKSRVLDELVHLLRPRTRLILRTRCSSEPGVPPYWPLSQALEQAQGLFEPPPGSGEPSDGGAGSAHAAGGTYASLVELLDPELNRGVPPAEVRFRFSRTVIRYLQELGSSAPVAILLDDLHEADLDTLHVVESVVREIAGVPVLIAASYRQGGSRRGGERSYLLARIAQATNAHQIRLVGFDEREIAQFIQQEAGVEPRAELVAALREKTEGNPFFLRETVRWLLEEGGIDENCNLAELGLPATVRDVTLRRLDVLSEECRLLLSWASVIGSTFTIPVLEQVTEMSSDTILLQLGDAENARIISSRDPSGPPRPPGEYGFAHALTAEALYQEISAPERVRRHRRVAIALEVVSGRSITERVGELAHHFFQAAPAGEVDRAGYYAIQAAERALEMFAYDDAVTQFRNLLTIEEMRVPRDDVRYCNGLLRLGDALSRTGRYADSEQTFLRAAELASHLDSAELYARAALGVAGDPFRRVGPEFKEDPARPSARELLERAVEWMAEGSLEVRARTCAALARRMVGSGTRAEELAQRAVELARDADSRTALFDALMAQLTVLVGPEHTEARLLLADEGVQLAKSLDAKPLLAQAYAARISLLIAIGDMDAADRDIAAFVALAKRLRVSRYMYDALRFRVCRAVGSGRFEEGRQLTNRLLELGREVGDPAAGWIAGSNGMAMLSFVERKREILRAAAESIASQEHMEGPTADTFAAYFAMSSGDKQVARARLERVAADGFAHYPKTEDWLWNLSLLADVCVSLRDVKRSEQLYELLLPYAHLNVVNRLSNYRGSLASVLGRLALILGDREAAKAHMQAAIEFNRKLGASVTVLVNRFFYAVALRLGAPAERAEARTIFKEVLAEAPRYGVLPFIERMRREAGVAF